VGLKTFGSLPSNLYIDRCVPLTPYYFWYLMTA
jgi:hypothetical protein